jgi:hypothetical protein
MTFWCFSGHVGVLLLKTYKYEIFDDMQGYILLKRLCKISTNWLMEVKQARFFQSYDTLTRV